MKNDAWEQHQLSWCYPVRVSDAPAYFAGCACGASTGPWSNAAAAETVVQVHARQKGKL